VQQKEYCSAVKFVGIMMYEKNQWIIGDPCRRPRVARGYQGTRTQVARENLLTTPEDRVPSATRGAVLVGLWVAL
jgi:hypothetical protein